MRQAIGNLLTPQMHITTFMPILNFFFVETFVITTRYSWTITRPRYLPSFYSPHDIFVGVHSFVALMKIDGGLHLLCIKHQFWNSSNIFFHQQEILDGKACTCCGTLCVFGLNSSRCYAKESLDHMGCSVLWRIFVCESSSYHRNQQNTIPSFLSRLLFTPFQF